MFKKLTLLLGLLTAVAAPAQTPAAAPAPPAAAPIEKPLLDLTGCKPTFSDEFNGDQLDPTKWEAPEMPRQGSCRWVKSLVSVRDGSLRLGIRLTDDPVLRYDCGAVRTQRNYDRSKTMFEQCYGYFEIRAKFPQNMKADYWSAFWLMCGNVGSPDTREGTEVDIMESFQKAGAPHYGIAFHWNGYGEKHNATGIPLAPTPELADGGFHRFGMYWDEHFYVAYFNGREVGRTDMIGLGKKDNGKTPSQGTCRKPGYLKLSCEAAACAGATNEWEKNPTKEDEFVVDYVRVYEGTLPQTITKAAAGPAPLPGNGLKQHPFLYAGEWDSRNPKAQSIFLVRDGKVAWQYSIPLHLCPSGIQEFSDVTMLANGNVVFACMTGAGIVTPEKNLIWQFRCPDGMETHSCQPMGKLTVLLALNGKVGKVLVINTATNTILKEVIIPTDNTFVHYQFRRANITPGKKTFMVGLLAEQKVLEMDFDGKVVWSCHAVSPWSAIRLKNGNTLISGDGAGYTREVNGKGDTVWEFTQKDAPFKLYNNQTANRLANGNTVIRNLVAGNKNVGEWKTSVQVFEVNPAKEVVWALSSWDNPDLGPHLHSTARRAGECR